MTQLLVDQLLKKMAEYHADEFIRLAFPKADFKLISTKLEKEVIFKTRIVDTVIKILDDNKPHLVHFEFQKDYDPKISERIFIYAGVLTAKYKLEVTSVLFQIKPPPKTVKQINSYNVKLFGTITNSFKFHCVRLWEYYNEILSGKKDYLGFVPLLLELSPDPNEELLIRQRQLIQQEKDIKRKAELTGLWLAMASRHFDFQYIKNIFEEDLPMLEALEEVPYIGERIKKARSEAREQGLKEGMIEGMKEGMQQGMQQGMRLSILEILENRFQSIDGVENLLDSITDVDKLKKIFKLAITIESLKALKDSIAEMKNQ